MGRFVLITSLLFFSASQCQGGGIEHASDGNQIDPQIARNFIFEDDDRWSRTANNGFALGQGDPTTLTWSVVPDGTPIVPRLSFEPNAPSNLQSTLNEMFGSQETWIPLLERTFDRISELSGLTYRFEPNDDGSPIREDGFSRGALGIRGDIRISGHDINSSGHLAYAYWPDNGDIVVNTQQNLHSVLDSDQTFFRNLIAHEHGHGLGFQHVFTDDRFLMRTGISDSFDGPQFDDILALHRGYGDALEKRGGNDSVAQAIWLGELIQDGRISLGTHGTQSTVFPDQSDFVSIDGLSDEDYFSFQLRSRQSISISVRPHGPTYQLGSDESNWQTVDASKQNDLSLELIGTNGRTVIAASKNPELGEPEIIRNLSLPSGIYHVRVFGEMDATQMYRVDIGNLSITELGDFDGNGILDVDDLNELTLSIHHGENDSIYDLNGDGNVDHNDRTFWVKDLKNTFFGDANLDQLFDSRDVVIVFQAGQFEDAIAGNSNWESGDWDGDCDFTTSDLILAFREDSFENGPRRSLVLPEPVNSWPIVLLLCRIVVCRVERKRPWHQPT